MDINLTFDYIYHVIKSNNCLYIMFIFNKFRQTGLSKLGPRGIIDALSALTGIKTLILYLRYTNMKNKKYNF